MLIGFVIVISTLGVATVGMLVMAQAVSLETLGSGLRRGLLILFLAFLAFRLLKLVLLPILISLLVTLKQVITWALMLGAAMIAA